MEFLSEIFKFNSCSPPNSLEAWRLFLRCLQRTPTKPISAKPLSDLICIAKDVATWITQVLSWGSFMTFLWSRWCITEARIKRWFPVQKKGQKKEKHDYGTRIEDFTKDPCIVLFIAHDCFNFQDHQIHIFKVKHEIWQYIHWMIYLWKLIEPKVVRENNTWVLHEVGHPW